MNLAVNLVQLGKLQPAEMQFKKASISSRRTTMPTIISASSMFARESPAAMRYLEQAQHINPPPTTMATTSHSPIISNRLLDARQLLQNLLKQKDSAELHNLLAEVEEKDGKFVAAANEYEVAAHLDPSEGNLFDWGSELLLHRTLDPAITVFEKAAERYPNSPRIAIGLGIAYYSRGNYDDAVKFLLHAADLSPADARVYPFLSRAYDSSPSQADEVITRFRRFAERQPKNGRAQYYYAMSLWKGKRLQDSNLDLRQIDALLKRAISLDPFLAEAHLQLGNLYSDQHKSLMRFPSTSVRGNKF